LSQLTLVVRDDEEVVILDVGAHDGYETTFDPMHAEAHRRRVSDSIGLSRFDSNALGRYAL